MKKVKILEIGPYPPPASGWSVRIKYVKEAFNKDGYDCQVLNLGKNRKKKSENYIDVQSGFDYLRKLLLLRFNGYHFHVHMNGQAVKGPILSLLALTISILTFERAALTFHGGIEQLYFPKRNGKQMYLIILLNFVFSKIIICNNEQIKKEIVNYGPLINCNKIKPIQAFSIQYMDYENVHLGDKVENFIKTKKHIITCYIVLRNGFYIETVLGFLENSASDIGIILVGIRNVEDDDISWQYQKLLGFQKKGKVLMVENLERNQFLSLLKRSDICLRTPISDGVASSVLEALFLGTPVVASENNRRPHGVITYIAEDEADLTNKINYVLFGKIGINNHVCKTTITDTVEDEVNSLLATFSSRTHKL